MEDKRRNYGSLVTISVILATLAISFVVYSVSQTNVSIGENVNTTNVIIYNNVTAYNVSVYNSFTDSGNYYLIDFNKTLTKVDKETYDRIVKNRGSSIV